MFGTNKKYLTVSINEGVIKVAQANAQGHCDKIARATFTPGASADDIAKALKTLLTSFNRSLPVICLVPSNAATAKIIEVPSSDPEEIKSIINLQASRHTPYSREEVLISHVNLGMNAAQNTRILLVIVHRDVVKDKISIIEKLALDIDKIIFIPEAQARFYAKLLNLKKDAPLTGIIDFSLNATNYIIIAKGSLLFERYIPIGIKAIVEGGQEAVVKLQEELKKSFEAFVLEEGSEAPNAYNVTMAHEALKTYLPLLEEGLKITLKVSSFVNSIKGSLEVRKKLQNDFGDDSFLDVIAPAVTAAKCEINLMPEEMILKKAVERQRNEGIMSFAAAFILMILVGGMLMSKIYFKDTFLNKNLRGQYAPQKAMVEELEQKMNKVKLVQGYIKTRMASLDIIHELYAITPTSIYLSNITVDEDGVITIDGIANSMSEVFSYVKSLNDSKKFKDAKTKSTATKKDNGNDVAAFEIEFKLNGTKEPAA